MDRCLRWRWTWAVILGACCGALIGVSANAGLNPPAGDARTGTAKLTILLDTTSTMEAARLTVADGMRSLCEALRRHGLEPSLELITFGDRSEGDELIRHRFGSDLKTSDDAVMSQTIKSLSLTDGGDLPESSPDALLFAARAQEQEGGEACLLLISDAPPKLPDLEAQSLAEVAHKLKQSKVQRLDLVR